MDAARGGFRYNGVFSVPPRTGLLPVCSGRTSTRIQARRPMLETNPIHNLLKDLSERTDVLRGYL